LDLLDGLPLWGLFIVALVVILLSIEGGHRLGQWRRLRTEEEKEAPVGAAVAAALGLLAFLIAFTFGLAASRFETRRTVLLDEANSIGTTYLRAGMLREPHRTSVRRLLREYVDSRLAAADASKFEGEVQRAEALHTKLWSEAVAVAESDPHSIVIGLFIQSLNETIDLHSKRLNAARRSRIPPTIWYALFAMAVISLAGMGYHSGLAKTCRSPVLAAVALLFAITIWLIADLDRPQEGSIRVSQRPMIDLKNSIAAPSP